MRGTVLLLDRDGSSLVDPDFLRDSGLIVQHCREPAQALKRLQEVAVDVVVVVPAQHGEAIVADLRTLADHATSIIVASVPEQCDEARRSGADAVLLTSAAPAELLTEIQRALILRRSGRRLPRNW